MAESKRVSFQLDNGHTVIVDAPARASMEVVDAVRAALSALGSVRETGPLMSDNPPLAERGEDGLE